MKILLIFLLCVEMVFTKESMILKDFVMGNKEFAAAVYKEIIKSKDGNMMVCPLSVEIVLALIHAGSEGKTAKELSDGLHLPEDKQKIREIFLELKPFLIGNESYTLSSANKIYVKDGVKIKQAFNNTAVEVFNAEIENIDFKQREMAAMKINQWVGKQTHDKIKNLISKDDLSDFTRVILINAIYFYGKWATQFHIENTSKKLFYLTNNKQVLVDMMDTTAHFKFLEDYEMKAQFLQLPYTGDDITMTIALPFEKNGLRNLEKRILDVYKPPFQYSSKVHVIMPKFKFETTIEFTNILRALGIVDIFTNDALLEGILEHERSKVNKVLQKTFIEVEEKGTTAAAATHAGLTTFGKAQSPREFLADHPFIFYISIKDVVLFTGRYTSPTN